MSNDRSIPKSRRRPIDAPSAPIDEAARARIETELRNHLSGREPEFASAVLARVAGTSAANERKNADQWFDVASRALGDERSLHARIESASETARVTLALLSKHAWWSRSALLQAIGMARVADDDSSGKAVAEVLSKWPVLVRPNSWTRSEELTLFEPLAIRLRPLLDRSGSPLHDVLAVGRSRGEHLPTVGLGRTLLALALFPGLVAQRRPRVTRTGELHGADATKLERALGEARGLFATWDRLSAFEEVDGALAPVSARVKSLLDDPGGLVAEFLKQRLGDLGWALATLAAQADEGDLLELGTALLAVGFKASFGFGFDIPSLAAHVERDDLRFSPLVHVDASENVLALPPDVRAAIRGEPIAIGPNSSRDPQSSSSPKSHVTGFVQPNYEVVMPPGVPLSAAFVVGCAAELVHLEAVARMKLTRESVLSARAVGIDVDDVIAALESIAGTRGVPPAVKHAITEWGESVGEARIRTAVLLEVRAADSLLEKVREKLAPLVLEQPTPRLFVLSRAPNPRELAALRTAGVLVRAVAGGTPKHTNDDDAQADTAMHSGEQRWPLVDRHRARDLRRALDPHRVLELVEASRPKKTPISPSNVPPVSTRGALDPDEGSERPIPAAVDGALTERRQEWQVRADWVRQLSQIADSPAFRRAAATLPGPLALAIRRAGDPQRLQLEVARLVAEVSVRRAAD